MAQPLASADRVAARAVVDSYAAKGVADAVLLVARDGVPVFREAIGLADRERGLANRDATAFRIGSVTKQFTALAILQLAADHRLSLDDRLSRFVADAPSAWRDVTIRHLLTHTSGIADFTSLPALASETWRGRDPADLVSVLRDLPLQSAPGSTFQYDNTGYVLLGLIVRKASGQTLGAYLSTHVFRPLRMSRTAFVGETPRRTTPAAMCATA